MKCHKSLVIWLDALSVCSFIPKDGIDARCSLAFTSGFVADVFFTTYYLKQRGTTGYTVTLLSTCSYAQDVDELLVVFVNILIFLLHAGFIKLLEAVLFTIKFPS